ncbi:helix-turn-helix domain-containing protein, partial [Streptomyces bambusae]|nr:helix-turn-helix domain-containing protein [Streptomyces bambusae]
MHPRKRPRKNASALRMVGAILRTYREAAGLTQRQLAEEVRSSEETIASIEQGRRVLLPDLAERLDRLLKTCGALMVAIEHMPEVDKIPAFAEEYMQREREALTIYSYENQVLPGLLQTDSYAEAVFRSRVPALPDDDVAERTAIRTKRQEILHRKDPVELSFIIWEPVLELKLGGSAVHRGQLERLITCSELPGISIQIFPRSHVKHPALDGPFVLLETPDHQHLAYTETQRGSHLIRDMDEVSIMQRKYAMLRTEALNPEETRAELDRLLGVSMTESSRLRDRRSGGEDPIVSQQRPQDACPAASQSDHSLD